MTARDLSELCKNLPGVAEEGMDFETIPEATLVERISESSGGIERAEALVAMWRRVFLALSLLDEEAISRGIWRFASFPALLCARSLLAGLADEGFRVFDKGFWDSTEYMVDRQRGLLRQLEEKRIAANQSCPPIRRVWVAWALISCDGRFLLVEREDSSTRDGNRGRFVLPGGRLSASDMEALSVSERIRMFNPDLQCNNSAELNAALTRTLTRELNEELEIEARQVASLSTYLEPIEYVDLEGPKSSHARTQYGIQLFRVKLTDTGKSNLLRALAKYPERYSWFTPDELQSGKNSKSETAYVDALRKTFREKLAVALDVKRSDIAFDNGITITEPFDLPGTVLDSLLIGEKGRERDVLLALEDDELTDLCFLAAVRRGDPISNLATGLSIVRELGWLIIDDDGLLAAIQKFGAKLRRELPELSLLAFQGRAVRLNVSNSHLAYFPPRLFSISAKDERRGKSYLIEIKRQSISSRLGTADPVAGSARVAEKLGAAIYGLVNNDGRNAIDDVDTVIRTQRLKLTKLLAEIGLRLLIRIVDGVPELTISEEPGTDHR